METPTKEKEHGNTHQRKGTWKHPPKKRNMETPTKEKEHGNTHQRKGTWKRLIEGKEHGNRLTEEKEHSQKGTGKYPSETDSQRKRNTRKKEQENTHQKQTHRGKGTGKYPSETDSQRKRNRKILIKGNGTWKRIVNEKKKHENRLAEGLGARKETSVKQGNYNDPITKVETTHWTDPLTGLL